MLMETKDVVVKENPWFSIPHNIFLLHILVYNYTQMIASSLLWLKHAKVQTKICTFHFPLKYMTQMQEIWFKKKKKLWHFFFIKQYIFMMLCFVPYLKFSSTTYIVKKMYVKYLKWEKYLALKTLFYGIFTLIFKKITQLTFWKWMILLKWKGNQ